MNKLFRVGAEMPERKGVCGDRSCKAEYADRGQDLGILGAVLG